MKTLAEYLIEYDACTDARQWAKDKTWQEVYSTCDRADWLLWLFVRSNPDDKRLRVLAAAKCANDVDAAYYAALQINFDAQINFADIVRDTLPITIWNVS
jgi:hypothetical protein